MASPYKRFVERIRGHGAQPDDQAGLVSNPGFLSNPLSGPDRDAHSLEIPMSDETPASAPKRPASGINWRGALSLFEKSNPHKGIERFGIPLLQTIKHYVFNDPFTTLLNAPRGRFIAVFFCLYMTTYFFFACVYMIFPSSCMNEPSRNFGHTFWFSFQTASTIGYSGDPGMFPDPNCNVFNLVVMVEIIFASLLNYCLMGAVFARFAAPLPKAQSIRFSSNAVLYQPQEKGGLWHFSFRMASIRKHSLLKPEISLLLAIPEGARSPSNAALRFLELKVEDMVSQSANLRLGLPVIVVHVVSPSSPLFDLSLEQMEERGLEIICFLDGMDPMTSNTVQARHSYRPLDVRMNENFEALCLQENWRGQMGLDFTQFDETRVTLPTISSDASIAGQELQPMQVPPLSPSPEMEEHMRQLRSQTLRSLSIAIPSPDGQLPVRPVVSMEPQRRLANPTPQLAAFLDAVLVDPGLSGNVKRSAALARAELMSATAQLHLELAQQQQQAPAAGSRGHAGTDPGLYTFATEPADHSWDLLHPH